MQTVLFFKSLPGRLNSIGLHFVKKNSLLSLLYCWQFKVFGYLFNAQWKIVIIESCT